MGVPTQIAQASGREQVRPAGGPHARSPAWVASLPSPSPRRSRQAPVSSTKWSTAGSLGQLVPEGREDFCHGFLPALLSPGPTVQAINVAAAATGKADAAGSTCPCRPSLSSASGKWASAVGGGCLYQASKSLACIDLH